MPLLEGIHPIGLAIALLLPWASGLTLLGAFMTDSRPAVLLGHGYMVGQIIVIVLLLVQDALGFGVSFLPPAVMLAAITLFSGAAWWLRSSRKVLPAPDRSALRHLLWLLPLCWFLFDRGSVLASELMTRPLYAWDAWMNWVPKAVVWFDQAELTPFVSPEEWLQSLPGAEVYTLGNWRASEYPPGIPLLLLWVMLGAGTSDHTLLYLPWLILPLALALAIWGHLRNRAAAPWLAALAVYAWLSQPLPNTHAVLAGYADLWMAAAFCLGAMALDEWQATDDLRYGALALLMAYACAMFKLPGLAFAGILVAAAIVVSWRPSVRLLSWAVAIGMTCLLVGLIAGMWPGLWQAGEQPITLGLPWGLPTLRIQPSPLLPYLWESLFVQANWHLLWLLVIVFSSFGLAARGVDILHNIALLAFLGGLGFLLAVFGFTHYFEQAVNGVTFNRALLYLSPLAVFMAFQQILPWFARASENEEITG